MSIGETLIPVIAIIFTFGIPGIIIFWYLYSRHRERMRLIEKGLPPEEVKRYFAGVEKVNRGNYSALKWGIIFTALGLGIFLGNFLEQALDLDEGVTFGIVIVLLGLGFLVYYFISNSGIKSASQQNPEIK